MTAGVLVEPGPTKVSATRSRKATFVRLRAVVTSLLILAAIGVGWHELGPVGLGGRASYVVTDGVSMLPHFHSGGLVVTRSRSSYRVGEVVAYHNHQLHAVVMHRIVARDGDRFVLRGDNNDFQDGFEPTASDIVGQEWLYMPRVGRFWVTFRSPRVFGVTLALLGFIAGTAFVPDDGQRRRRHAG